MKIINQLILLFLLLVLASLPTFSDSKYITPADNAKISRYVGEAVMVECKKMSPFSSNCHVDCGNGRRFRQAKGYCYYLTVGQYRLSVSTRYRGRNYNHTASISISEKLRAANVRQANAGKPLAAGRVAEQKEVTQRLSNRHRAPDNLNQSQNSRLMATNTPVIDASTIQNGNIIPAVDSDALPKGIEQITVTNTSDNLFENQLGSLISTSAINQDTLSPTVEFNIRFGENVSDTNKNTNGFQDSFVQRP